MKQTHHLPKTIYAQLEFWAKDPYLEAATTTAKLAEHTIRVLDGFGKSLEVKDQTRDVGEYRLVKTRKVELKRYAK